MSLRVSRASKDERETEETTDGHVSDNHSGWIWVFPNVVRRWGGLEVLLGVCLELVKDKLGNVAQAVSLAR